MRLLVFADERKKVLQRWDYIAITIVPTNQALTLYNDLVEARRNANYDYKLSFSSLNKSGKGSKVELANMWIDKVIENASHNMGRLFFKVFGIDRSKLDFAFFGPLNGPIGTYTNIYNRFFRTALLGALNYFFPDVPITIQKIFHDTEGNLQHHTYFDWHCIRQISERDNRITFTCRRVTFVNSNHLIERHHPKASHVIQLTDLIVGSVTYCIHETNLQNRGQFKVSEKILPLVNNVLTKPYDQNNSLGYYKKYDICHFPREHLRFLNEDRIPGEFFRLRCDNFLDRVTGQQLLDFS